jgi:hypothetical protein
MSVLVINHGTMRMLQVLTVAEVSNIVIASEAKQSPEMWRLNQEIVSRNAGSLHSSAMTRFDGVAE